MSYTAASQTQDKPVSDQFEQRDDQRCGSGEGAPFNSNAALVVPSVIAPSQGGPVLLSTDGTLWKSLRSLTVLNEVSE